MRPWQMAALLVSMSVAASATEFAGVDLVERTKLGRSEVVLNGAGLRKMAFCKVYVGALYLTEKKSSPEGVYALAGSKRISITLMRKLPALKFVAALKGGIRENSSNAEQLALNDRVEELSANLLTLEQGKKGDTITLDWLPEEGTLVVLNGQVKGKPIPGDDLYRALLRVFLGDHPTSPSLKKALLGQMSS